MLESWSGRAAFAGLSLAAAPLAAQGQLPRPAADSIEVTVSVSGTVEVPAQGYRLGGFLFHGGRAAAADSATRALVEQLEAADRKTCLPSYPIGFIGNELFLPEDESAPAETAAGAESAEPDLEQPGNDWSAAMPESYAGLFVTRASAERARAMLLPQQPGALAIQPVLFDCAEAVEKATLAALAKSQTEAAALARALGMRNAGVVRIKAGEGDQNLAILSGLRNGRAVQDTVEASAALSVTFRLEK